MVVRMCSLCLRCILDKNKAPVLELSKDFACLLKILIFKKISLLDSVLWPKTVVQKNSFRLISQDRIVIYDSHSGWLHHKFASGKLLITLRNFMNIFRKEYLLRGGRRSRTNFLEIQIPELSNMNSTTDIVIIMKSRKERN